MKRPDAPRTAISGRTLGRAARMDHPLTLLGLLAVVSLIGFGLELGSDTAKVAVFWVMLTGLHLTFAVCAWRASLPAGISGTSRRLWRVIGFAGGAFVAGDVIQVVAVARDPLTPTSVAGTSAQALFIAAGLLALLIGMLTCPMGITSAGERSRLRLDLATVMVAATTFGMYAFALPAGSPSPKWIVNLMLAVLVEPGISVLAVFAVIKLMLSAQPPCSRGAGWLCGLSAALTVLLQVVPMAEYALDAHGPLLYGGHIVAACLLAGGARVQQVQARVDPAMRSSRPRRPYSLLPYGAIALTYLLLVFALVTDGLDGHAWVVLGGAIVSTALVVARQLAAFRHIAELLADRDALTEQLTEIAFHDGLTGLANRALFMKRLHEAVWSGGGELAVVLVDMDDFKPVNDRYGHAVGDELLRRVGRWLTEAVRGGDTVARLGGDEFAVLVTNLPPGARSTLGQRMSAALHRDTYIGAIGVRVRGSVGIAFARPGTRTPDELLQEADMAMYATKRRHKDHAEAQAHAAQARSAEAR